MYKAIAEDYVVGNICRSGSQIVKNPQDVAAQARELQDAVLQAQKEPGLADLEALLSLSKEVEEIAEFQNQHLVGPQISFAADSVG